MEIFINRNFKFEYERESLKADFKRVNDYYKSYKIMNADDEVKFQSNHSEDLRFVRYAYSELHLPESPEIIKYQHYSALFNGKKRKEAYEFNSKKLAGRIYGYGYGDPSIFVNCLKKFKSKYSKINQ